MSDGLNNFQHIVKFVNGPFSSRKIKVIDQNKYKNQVC